MISYYDTIAYKYMYENKKLKDLKSNCVIPFTSYTSL